MKLNKTSLQSEASWNEMEISLPQFYIEQVVEKTKSYPTWVHIGAGNIFRGFIARAYQEVLNMNLADTGISVVESFDFEVIDKVYKPYDQLSLLVQMHADGKFDKTVVGSIAESMVTDPSKEDDAKRIKEIFEADSLQLVSFTITEKGYAIKTAEGTYIDIVKKDIENGPSQAAHTMSYVAAKLFDRYQKGAKPLTVVSMDNCSHNGDKLKDAVTTIAKEWEKLGFVDSGFIEYIFDENRVSFPLSMIDKITPRPSEDVKKYLEDCGIEGMEPIVTKRQSYMAPFVNAETAEYLVIEDKFSNGRPKLEKAGVIFTDRETVNRIETMKVTTCLNPLHTALAVTGCLLGYTLIADEMKDATLLKLVETIGYHEGMKVVTNPGIINPETFLDEVINERFKNPYIPDTPQRIATDTSQKVGIRFGETLKSYVKSDGLDVRDLIGIPLAISAWCRYLMGIDDNGENFEISPDPMADELQGYVADINLGDTDANLKSILSREDIFGSNLYEIGLGDKIERLFNEMIAGKGAVRNTLNKYLNV